MPSQSEHVTTMTRFSVDVGAVGLSIEVAVSAHLVNGTNQRRVPSNLRDRMWIVGIVL